LISETHTHALELRTVGARIIAEESGFGHCGVSPKMVCLLYDRETGRCGVRERRRAVIMAPFQETEEGLVVRPS
jgi:hypothetical protein